MPCSSAALAKDPAERYRSCGELVANLRSAFADSAGTTVRMVGAAAPTAATVVAPPRAARVETIRARDRRDRCRARRAGAPRHRPRRGRRDGGDDALPPTTVVRTATVAGEPQVRTVTVEAQPVTPPAASARRRPVTAPAAASGAALNDQGFRLLTGRRCGGRAADSRACRRRAAGLRLADRGIRARTTSPWPGSRPATAPASRSCSTAPSRSRASAREIKQLRHEVDKGCEALRLRQTGFGRPPRIRRRGRSRSSAPACPSQLHARRLRVPAPRAR